MATFGREVSLLLLLITVNATAQKVVPLVQSGQVMREAIALHDSGRYEEAIARYKTIPARDTAYVRMLSELALTYDANKDYEAAISTCKEGLKDPGEYEAHLLRTLAIAIDHKGDYEQSVRVFQDALNKFPFDHSLHYNLGVTHYNNGRYQEAVKSFFDVLRINPFHAGSHLNLGRLAAFQGGKVRSMMSFGMYLSIANTDNARLVFLERFLNNEIDEEGSIQVTGPTAFDKLDQIIRARVVTDKNFKAVVPVNAILTKQYQLFLDQISLIENDADDPWVSFYLPVYKAIKDQSLLEPFLYHILSSTTFEAVAKWKKKNEKKLDEFFTLANNRLSQHRLVKTMPEAYGYTGPVSCWYNEDNVLVEIGNKGAGDVRVGKWRYYTDHHTLQAEGTYNDRGEKTGVWKYYSGDGTISSIEDLSSGEIKGFGPNGELAQRYFLKGGEIDGPVELYNPCGGVREKLVYVAGKRSGDGDTYYPNGQKESHYTYRNDKLEGEYLEYYADGILKSKTSYKEGLRDGPFEEYYGNGTLRQKGEYDSDNATGAWTYLHMNGKPEKRGQFIAGNPQGTWSYYDLRGNLIEERTFDEEGNIHGENVIYSNDRVHFTLTYDHGKIVGVVYLDAAGEEISRSGDPSGTFEARGYFPDGRLRFEGGYREGKADGKWTYYFRSGVPEKEYTCVDGLTHGRLVEYFPSGRVKFDQTFNEGEVHGYSVEYYDNGKIKEQGWYQNGLREQQWLAWHQDGTLESDYYYRNGDLEGESVTYNYDGKKYTSFVYREGRPASFAYYDERQNTRLEMKTPANLSRLIQKNDNGSVHTEMSVTCGQLDDKIAEYYPNGKLYYFQQLLNGYRHGEYARYYPNGKPETNGRFVAGEKHGKWTWYYDDGTRSSEGKYVADEPDSIWTGYFYNGVVSSRTDFLEGKRQGLTQYFGPDGTLILEKRYEEDDLVDYRALTRSGSMGEWIPVKPDDSLVAYYPNGKPAYQEFRKGGMLNGPNRLYYPDGTLHYEYNYSDGSHSGVFKVQYPDGKPLKTGTYSWGEMDGTIEYYKPDGTKRMTQTFKLGTRNGAFVFYENGQPPQSYTFWAGIIAK